MKTKDKEGNLEWAVHPKQRAMFIRQFAKAILHGDDEHKAWLLEAAESYIKDGSVPPPRSNPIICQHCHRPAK